MTVLHTAIMPPPQDPVTYLQAKERERMGITIAPVVGSVTLMPGFAEEALVAQITKMR
jgi:hypothetical protein